MRKLLASLSAIALVFVYVDPAFGATGPLTQTPTNLQADDVGVLQTGITGSATSLTISPVKKYLNTVRTTGCFNTGSGFLLLEDGTGRKEWASFNGNSCSASFVTTLSNLRRSLSSTGASFTGGAGFAWDAGSRVRVIDYPLVYNNMLKKDVPNFFGGSGALLCGSTSQPCFFTNTVTTVQRDAFTYGTGRMGIIFNSTLGVGQYYNPTSAAWYNFGSGSTINATITAAGKVEKATVANLSGSAITDDTGAPLAVTSDLFIRHSSGAINSRNKGVTTNNNGYLSGSLLGSGIPTSSKILYGNQTWATLSASGGNVLGATALTTDVGVISSTTWTTLGSGLNITGFAASGSLLHYDFMMQAYQSANSDMGCNVLISRDSGTSGMLFLGGSGAYMHFQVTAADELVGYSYSWTAKTNTGGNLLFTPKCRVNGGSSFNPQAPVRFSVFKIQ